MNYSVTEEREYGLTSSVGTLARAVLLFFAWVPLALGAERGGVEWTSVTRVRIGGDPFTMSDLGPGPYVHIFPDNRIFEAFAGVQGEFFLAEQIDGGNLTRKLDQRYYPQPDYRFDVQRRWVTDSPPEIRGQAQVSFAGSVDVLPFSSYYSPLNGVTIREWYWSEKKARLLVEGDRTLFEVENSSRKGVMSLYARTRPNISVSNLSNQGIEVVNGVQVARTWMREDLVFAWNTEESTRVDADSEFVDSDGYLIAWLDARVLATGSGADLSVRFFSFGGRELDTFSREGIEVSEIHVLSLPFKLCKLELVAGGDLQCGPSLSRSASGSFDLDFTVRAESGAEGALLLHPGLTAEPSAERSVAFSDDVPYGFRVRTPSGVTWASQSGVFLAPIPEPSTCVMLAVGLALLGFVAKNEKR